MGVARSLLEAETQRENIAFKGMKHIKCLIK